MRPAITVLQLDTDFPRVAGDVGCAGSYLGDVQILRIPSATVAKVVTSRPETIDILPFEAALSAAKGEIITTSCGFLSYWQNHLAARTENPFVSSSLIALDDLSQRYQPEELIILTFDSNSLNTAHLGQHRSYASSIIGLPDSCHLRDVISQNLGYLDTALASREICAHIAKYQTKAHRHILLECTNLPPYKAALLKQTGLAITDILTVIESARANTVQPDFLKGQTL